MSIVDANESHDLDLLKGKKRLNKFVEIENKNVISIFLQDKSGFPIATRHFCASESERNGSTNGLPSVESHCYNLQTN